MNSKKYMIVILGSSNGVEDDLYSIADGEHGVNYVNGAGIFIGTFKSVLTTDEIYGRLGYRPAFIIYDISNEENFAINLPSKYYEGIFPEVRNIAPEVVNEYTKEGGETIEEKIKDGELTDLNQIIDKLQNNNYDTNCLTENERNILENP